MKTDNNAERGAFRGVRQIEILLIYCISIIKTKLYLGWNRPWRLVCAGTRKRNSGFSHAHPLRQNKIQRNTF